MLSMHFIFWVIVILVILLVVLAEELRERVPVKYIAWIHYNITGIPTNKTNNIGSYIGTNKKYDEYWYWISYFETKG